jgi:serine/threonine protein kinase
VDEIHQYGIVHSDLKPVNFILVAGKLKLIDFGIANAIQANYTSVYKESQIGNRFAFVFVFIYVIIYLFMYLFM